MSKGSALLLSARLRSIGTRLLRGTCIATSALMMTACSSLTPPSKAPIPASLLQPCQPLNELDGVTGADVLKNITDNAAIYHACADGKAALIRAVK